MVRKIFKPLFPDEPGDEVTFIPGTDRKYAMTENGNTYRANGQDLLEEGQVPLKPERPNTRRDHYRLRIRLKTDPPEPKRPYHCVAFLMMKTFRPGDWPDYDTGKWRLEYRNGNNRDCRLSNLQFVEGAPRDRRNRLTRTESKMALCLMRRSRKSGWKRSEIAHALNVKLKVLDKLAVVLETEKEKGRKASRRYLKSK